MNTAIWIGGGVAVRIRCVAGIWAPKDMATIELYLEHGRMAVAYSPNQDVRDAAFANLSELLGAEG